MTTVTARALTKADSRSTADSNKIAPLIAVVGLMIATITAIIQWAKISDVGVDDASVAETGLWAGGLGIFGLVLVKIAIGLVLVGIVAKLWTRAESVKSTVPLMTLRKGAPRFTPMSRPTVTSPDIPKPLPIHKMAMRMWKPMFAMGFMAVVVGAILRFAGGAETAGSEDFRQLAAWGLGVEFLGETLVIAGISFLLGTIMASLREAGSEVQKAAGATISVLKMSPIAKGFIGLMMLGTMLGIGQFIASIVLAGKADDPGGYAELAAVVGPLREVALGILLSGVVLALATIGTVLTFQFDRVRDLVRHN